MKHVCMTYSLWVVVTLLLTSCQRSSAVTDDDSETLTDSVLLDSNETDKCSDEVDIETVVEMETESIGNTETASVVEVDSNDTNTIVDTVTGSSFETDAEDTSTAIDTLNDSSVTIGTDDTETQGDSDSVDSIIGSWIVTSLTVDGVDKPITSQYALVWEEDGETFAINAAIFMENPNWDDVYVDGMGNLSPCEGTTVLLDSNEIELDFVCRPLSSVIIGDACPLECSQWIYDYETAMNSATIYEVNDVALILFNDDQTNIIHFKRSSITSEDLPF